MKTLISETTREDREHIISESIGNIDGLCDGCACGILEMYQPYIEGIMELKDINALFARQRCGAQATEPPAAAPADDPR